MQVTAWVAKHRKRGDSWSELVRKTGVSMLALQRWSSSPVRRAVMFRRVEVVEAAPTERTVTLVSPTGIRIEGVTITEVIEILRGMA
jgi:hypothetical protein